MEKPSFLTREAVRNVYDRNARFYDFAVWFYYLAGMPIGRWRRMVVDALELRLGDTVVEVGCGTGLNFDLLQKAVGPNGKIIGIDISEAMLDRARALVQDKGWQNVELVCCSVSDFEFPDGIGGIMATGVLTYEPEFDRVVERGAKALSSRRKWGVLDYKLPTGWQRIFAPLFVALGSSFGVSKNLMERHIWEAVERHLKNMKMQELYGGFVYIVSGEAP
jgi:demethylmenaquinone methyltransferase/2-methoxy-6-polyprenyl-1,4-benzoquinol methylase